MPGSRRSRELLQQYFQFFCCFMQIILELQLRFLTN